MAISQHTQTVIDAFNALADQVQALADRRIVLEHKLRFAHEQFQFLADKYAPAAPEIAKALANLQPPPYHSVDDASLVPLPRRDSCHSQHQIALIIRDGRRAATKLGSQGEASKTTVSTRDTLSQPSLVDPSMPTTLEQDFTVQGRKGHLLCPFTNKDRSANGRGGGGAEDAKESDDDQAPALLVPEATATVCPSLLEEPRPVNGGQAAKCPIRFLDERSPEEIAQYVEAHKHDLPRSHELCLRRYQRSEDQIRKLDSKYGNVVSMIEDLSQLHKPMLPDGDQARRRSTETGPSHHRVESWAQQVEAGPEAPPTLDKADDGRQGRFDRLLKEIRVGESPSRPWGISVPVYDPPDLGASRRSSPPPAPVRMPGHMQEAQPSRTGTSARRHAGAEAEAAPGPKKCPFDHSKMRPFADLPPPDHEPKNHSAPFLSLPTDKSTKGTSPPPRAQSQPAFINLEPAAQGASPSVPQMIFTGPVFIGYPMEQAVQFMNQFSRPQ